MQATKISYEQVKNLGNYQSARYGIEVTLNEGESAAEAMERAKKFVDHYINGNGKPIDPDAELRAQAKKIIASGADLFADENPPSVDEVEGARQWLAAHPEPKFDF